MKKILIISFTDIATDVRLIRQIKALHNHFEIHTCGYGLMPNDVTAHHEIPNNLEYLPIKFKSLFYLFIKRFNKAYLSTPVIKWIIDKFELSISEYQIIYCNDVLTSGIPYLFGNNSLKIIDLHEYAPREMEEDWRFRLLLATYYTWLCSYYLYRYDSRITVSPSIANEYKKRFNTYFHVILNAPMKQNFSPTTVNENCIKIVHSGIAVKRRNLDTLIKVCSQLQTVSLDLYLVESKKEISTLINLKKLAENTPNCRVLDPINQHKLLDVLNKYDLGLLFFPNNNFNLVHSLPNKFFDFIQSRLMIVSSPCIEIKNFIRKYELGVVTEDFQANTLLHTLANISAGEVKKYKEKSNQAAYVLNYETEATKLLNIINSAYEKRES